MQGRRKTMNSVSFKSRRAAFTLIELRAVVAIAALLISLLLPALEQTQRATSVKSWTRLMPPAWFIPTMCKGRPASVELDRIARGTGMGQDPMNAVFVLFRGMDLRQRWSLGISQTHSDRRLQRWNDGFVAANRKCRSARGARLADINRDMPPVLVSRMLLINVYARRVAPNSF